MARAVDVARLVHLNGGHLVGKTRLQKSTYFLEAMEAGFGFDFSYYHFGPYSEELSASADEAQALELLHVSWKRALEGTEYAIFSSKAPEFGQDPKDNLRREILEILRKYSSVELELAATAEFLKRHGHSKDAWAETRRRKASKYDERRAAHSRQLLNELSAFGHGFECEPLASGVAEV